MKGPTRNTTDGAVYLDLRRMAKADGRAIDELLTLFALKGFLDRRSTSHARAYHSTSRSSSATAAHRNVALVHLDEALAGYAEVTQGKWRAWVRKQRLPEDFAVVLQDVLVLAGPAVGRAATAQTWDHLLRGWTPH